MTNQGKINIMRYWIQEFDWDGKLEFVGCFESLAEAEEYGVERTKRTGVDSELIDMKNEEGRVIERMLENKKAKAAYKHPTHEEQRLENRRKADAWLAGKDAEDKEEGLEAFKPTVDLFIDDYVNELTAPITDGRLTIKLYFSAVESDSRPGAWMVEPWGYTTPEEALKAGRKQAEAMENAFLLKNHFSGQKTEHEVGSVKYGIYLTSTGEVIRIEELGFRQMIQIADF